MQSLISVSGHYTHKLKENSENPKRESPNLKSYTKFYIKPCLGLKKYQISLGLINNHRIILQMGNFENDTTFIKEKNSRIFKTMLIA